MSFSPTIFSDVKRKRKRKKKIIHKMFFLSSNYVIINYKVAIGFSLKKKVAPGRFNFNLSYILTPGTHLIFTHLDMHKQRIGNFQKEKKKKIWLGKYSVLNSGEENIQISKHRYRAPQRYPS